MGPAHAASRFWALITVIADHRLPVGVGSLRSFKKRAISRADLPASNVAPRTRRPPARRPPSCLPFAFASAKAHSCAISAKLFCPAGPHATMHKEPSGLSGERA